MIERNLAMASQKGSDSWHLCIPRIEFDSSGVLRKNPISLENTKLRNEAVRFVLCLSKEPKELIELFCSEALDFLERFEDLCSLFAVNLPSWQRQETLNLWTLLHISHRLIPCIKYSVIRAFNLHLQLPPTEVIADSECPVDCLKGNLLLFPLNFRLRLQRIRSPDSYLRKRSLFLINSLFQGWKKGLLPFSVYAYDSNLIKHRSAMTANKPASREILDVTHRVTQELLKKFCLKPDKTTLLPSKSSTIESKKSEFGALGLLIRSMKDFWDFDQFPRNATTFLVGFVESSSSLEEIRGWGYTHDEVYECQQHFLSEKVLEEDTVSPYGIFEALKIRMITRPNYFTHLGLRPLQKSLLRFLGDRHYNGVTPFGIISDSNKLNLKSYIAQLMRPDLGFWVSGDYSAATDRLKSDVSRVILECIGSRIPWWMYVKAEKSLFGCKVDYGERSHLRIGPDDPWYGYQWRCPTDTVSMTNGQLMGHILSFPILCIANYAAYHCSWERFYRKTFSVKELMDIHPVLVNGDDILFRSSTALCCME
jgi:hypothetical protein